MGDAYVPSFSPNGKHIVYTQTTPKRWRTLHIINANGGGHKEFIPSDGLFRTSPRWSPDGKKILFSESHIKNLRVTSSKVVIQWVQSGVSRMDRRVLKTPKHWWKIATVCWMDNGKQVLIAANAFPPMAPQYDLYRYNLATHEIVNLTNTPGSDYGQDWISDATLSVSPVHKKKVLWGVLKAPDKIEDQNSQQ